MHTTQAQQRRMAHQFNLDTAQREIDRRHAEGEDMAGATICPRTYAIRKPARTEAAQAQLMVAQSFVRGVLDATRSAA